MSTTEADFQADIIAAAKTFGVEAFHPFNSRASEPGWPDLTLVGAGVMFRELKTQRGIVTPSQAFWIAILSDAGLDAAVWRPDQWPEPIISQIRSLGRIGRIKPVYLPKRRAR